MSISNFCHGTNHYYLFRLYDVPPVIISWLQLINQLLTKNPVSPNLPSKRKLGVLTGGADSCQIWVSKINGLRNMIEHQEQIFCPRLRSCAKEIIVSRQTNQFSKEGLSKPPLRMFVRSFGRTFG